MWQRFIRERRPLIFGVVGGLGILFIVGEIWLIDSSGSSEGNTREYAAIVIASVAAIFSAIDIAATEVPTPWSLVAAYLSVIAAAVVGGGGQGALQSDGLAFIVLVIFAIGLILLTTFWIVRVRAASEKAQLAEELETKKQVQAAPRDDNEND